ncbi:hypothetical protein OH492_11300 [Vibrio chagasii]|nr:hypothetical protein [Vibrio chagasii]
MKLSRSLFELAFGCGICGANTSSLFSKHTGRILTVLLKKAINAGFEIFDFLLRLKIADNGFGWWLCIYQLFADSSASLAAVPQLALVFFVATLDEHDLLYECTRKQVCVQLRLCALAVARSASSSARGQVKLNL